MVFARAIPTVDGQADPKFDQLLPRILDADVLESNVLDRRPIPVMDRECATALDVDDVTVLEDDAADRFGLQLEADLHGVAPLGIPQHRVDDGDVLDVAQVAFATLEVAG